MTVEDFGNRGVSGYRNPNRAEAMRVLPLARRDGSGIPAARRALPENGPAGAEFEVTPSLIRFVVRIRTPQET